MVKQKTIPCEIRYIIPEIKQEIRKKGNIKITKWNQFKIENEEQLLLKLNKKLILAM